MYKLVAVGGKIRGKEVVLKEGENIVGRDAGCDHVLDLEGISKKHMKLFVNKNDAFVEDLGSSNGTLVNGKLVTKMTVKNGDKIALPGLILQIVYVEEEKVIVKKQVGKAAEELEFSDTPSMPSDPIEKLKWVFRYKIMRPIYTVNQEYEWGVVVAILLVLFVISNIVISIGPILIENKNILKREVALRAAHYADEIGRLNAIALEQKDLDRLDTNFLNNEQGVEGYELFDADGRIVRPVSKINEYTSDPFSLKSKDLAVSTQPNQTYVQDLGDGRIGVAKRIKAYNARLGYEELVGIIAIIFAPESLVTADTANTVSYLRALFLCLVIGVLVFSIIFSLTVAPLEELQRQIESYLRGKKFEVKSSYLFSTINPLRESVKTLMQKISEMEDPLGESGFNEEEDEAPYLERLNQFLIGCPGPGLVLNSEKNISKINLEAEDLIGIRENAAQGENILDVAKEKGFAATIVDLCDQCANNESKNQKGTYELQGKEYDINVVGLQGRDNFAKGFLVTFIKA